MACEANMSADSKMRAILIGCGEISKRQHIPILNSRPHQFKVDAIIDPEIAGTSDDRSETQLPAPVYSNFQEVTASSDEKFHVAVIACPPQFAQDYAECAIQNNLHVFMEKPPGLDYQRLGLLREQARQSNLTLFTAYHSTVAPEVGRAKEWVRNKKRQINNVSIVWKESCAKWHPGQMWITTNTFGVLDMLINPISMVEEIIGEARMEDMVVLKDKSTIVIPRNWTGPISGVISLVDGKSSINDSTSTIHADFAWNNEEGGDIWTISFQSRDGSTMELHEGGARIKVDGVDVTRAKVQSDVLRREYEALYDQFVTLVDKRESVVQTTPLRIMNEILEKSSISQGEEYSLA